MTKVDLKIKRDKSDKNEIHGPEYPTLWISDTQLPLTKEQIGKSLEAKVTIKFVGYNENNSTKKNHVSYDLAIQDIEFIDSTESKVKAKLDKTFNK